MATLRGRRHIGVAVPTMAASTVPIRARIDQLGAHPRVEPQGGKTPSIRRRHMSGLNVRTSWRVWGVRLLPLAWIVRASWNASSSNNYPLSGKERKILPTALVLINVFSVPRTPS